MISFIRKIYEENSKIVFKFLLKIQSSEIP